MSRYIDADRAIESLFDYCNGKKTIGQCIDDTPTEEVKPIVYGEWEIDGHHIRCNKCNIYMCNTDREGDSIPQNFCPNCGADMRKESEEE